MGPTTTESHVEVRHVTNLAFPSEHPSFPGHFPGNPVVAGVLLIESILAFAEYRLGHPVSVTRVPLVKFQTPLKPDQEVQLEVKIKGPQLEFAVTLGAATVAKGRLMINTPPAHE